MTSPCCTMTALPSCSVQSSSSSIIRRIRGKGISDLMLGSHAGASLMAHFTIDGVFYFMAAAALFLTFLAAVRSFTTMAPHHAERPFEILAPQAATLAHAPLDASDEPLSRDPIKVPSEDN